MRRYYIAGCGPEMDGNGCSDPYLTLRSQNWEKYFWYCGVKKQKYVDQGSRIAYKIDALDYKDFYAQVGDVVLVYYEGTDIGATHAAIVTEVADGKIIEIVGDRSEDPDNCVITYGMDGTENKFFLSVAQSHAKVTIAGYASSCTTAGVAP